jgi:hypothetical protein
MKTELVVLGKHLSVASQRSRRWLVAMIYAAFAAIIVAWSMAKAVTGAWCISFGLAFVLLFMAIAGDRNDPADEREKRRREHANFLAYRPLGDTLILALIAGYFRGPNPITPLAGPVLRAVLMQLPYMLVMAAGALYMTLPQAILMWTEPDIDPDQAETISLWAKS